MVDFALLALNFKATLATVSILTIMDNMTMCNVKRIVHSDEPHRELSPNSADSLSSMEPFSRFRVIVLVFWPPTPL